jgi:alkanesulfonate monooxygenase SsuD/methylene tetrahydromethanopterin reductase-like flavin-dependent oxidoreductase (luciferase family)
MLACSFVGAADTLRSALDRFIKSTAADELMIASAIYDHAARLRSYEIFSEIQQWVSDASLSQRERVPQSGG